MAVKEIKSVIAGKVWKLTCKAGDRLAGDDPLMILESMKMEIPVPAPGHCTVKQILVQEGEHITEGQTVAHIEN